jgi:hypothetical protein
MTTRIPVAVEETPKRTFATAIDWPGWSRSGRTVSGALEAIAAYAGRYAVVAAAAGEPFPADDIEVEVFETSGGGGGTEFGVPSRVTEADGRPTTAAEADRLARIVDAAWACLDGVAAGAPEELRKGPRGGGRNTSKVVAHALEADHAYAREMGLKLPAPVPGDPGSVRHLRELILEVLRQPSDGSPIAGRRWTVRYAAHRIAWHSLDHAWEIEDRSRPEPAG